jgi:hypothetical protein
MRALSAIAALLSAGCIGTLDLTADRERVPVLPVWQERAVDQPVPGCASVFATVSQSGRTGLGVNVLARGQGERRCELEILAARLEVGNLSIDARHLPPRLRVTQGDAVWFYLPFLFDNAAQWRRGERSARLAIRLRADAAEERELTWELEQSP